MGKIDSINAVFTPPRPSAMDAEAAAPAQRVDDVGWLITLSDLSLLLLCFFIVLHVAAAKRAARESAVVAAEPAVIEAESEPEAVAESGDAAPAEELPEALTLSFAPGTADLKRDMFPVLQQILDTMQTRPALGLEIVGHTDDRPIATAGFPSNWELSAARASGVARYLIQKGIDPARLSVQGYAAFRPAAPNADNNGRGANRRVELSFYRAGASAAAEGKENRPIESSDINP